MLFHKIIGIHPAWGWGDSWILYPAVKHFLKRGAIIKIRTCDFGIFSPLNSLFHRPRIIFSKTWPSHRTLFYDKWNWRQETTQFEDCCQELGIKEKIDYIIDYPVRTPFKKVDHRPLVVIKAPCHPGKWLEPGARHLIVPDYTVYKSLVESLRPKCYTVLVGKNSDNVGPMPKTDLDVSGPAKTELDLLLGLIYSCDLIICPQGHMIHLGEGFGKKVFAFYSQQGLTSGHTVVGSITPQKMLTRKDSCYGTDAESIDNLRHRVLSML